jgi:hypothetical protein
LAARNATRGQRWRVFIAADQRLDGVDEVLHPLFEAASGPVGRIEDAGQVLEPVGGGDQMVASAVASCPEGRSPSCWARLMPATRSIQPRPGPGGAGEPGHAAQVRVRCGALCDGKGLSPLIREMCPYGGNRRLRLECGVQFRTEALRKVIPPRR